MKANVIIDVEGMGSPRQGDVIAYDEKIGAWRAVPKEAFLREVFAMGKELEAENAELRSSIEALTRNVNTLAKAIGGK